MDPSSVSKPVRPALQVASDIAAENARPGSDGWQITRPAGRAQIEGYADRLSAIRGEDVRLFVRTASAARFTFEVWRMGWYGGAGGRRVLEPVETPSLPQPDPSLEEKHGTVRCAWNSAAMLRVEDDWPTGVYLVKLTALGFSSYIPLVVRDDSARGAIMFQTSVFTYAAYNDWGGRSAYGKKRSTKVSFDRPFVRTFGAGDFGMHEAAILRFVERLGLPVIYVTDLDTHRAPERLLDQRALLIAGHDEYWTRSMRDGVEAGRDEGVHVAFLGANDAYWQVRLEDDDRTMVAFKERASKDDPMFFDAEGAASTTTRWRDTPVARPEHLLAGVEYRNGAWGFETDWRARSEGHWLMEGTGLRDGDILAGLVGGEADRRADDTPSCVELIGDAEATTEMGRDVKSETTIYTAASGALVFAWGSFDISAGLDAYAEPPRAMVRTSSAAQRIIGNLLQRF